MTGTWTTAGGVEVPHRVPARPRRRYVEQGLVPGRDLSALLRAQATAHPERPAVIYPEGTLGCAALDRRARRIGAATTAGCAPGTAGCPTPTATRARPRHTARRRTRPPRPTGPRPPLTPAERTTLAGAGAARATPLLHAPRTPDATTTGSVHDQ
ncbi:hypothetical protein [Streptomyces sp. HYC2]|uniref:hypothetical protein n=1 Tax=Streptomyces sp. HYC2 TaxID=2955207 RepID=UPI002481010A|nr:hypothetical protein [Streptomyces sp. HYC2]